jgi:hypothetical protein
MKKLFLFVFALSLAQLTLAQWEDDFRLTDNIDTSYLHYTFSHCIAASGDTIHVVWYEKIDDNWEIFYMRSTDGGYNFEWETRLTETIGFSKNPSVAASGSSVYVSWEEYIDGNRDIFFIRSTDGGENWGEAARLTNDTQISYSTVIAANESYIYLGWVKKDLIENTWKIYYKLSSDGGLTWSTETWISPNSPDAYALSLAVSGSDVHFTWTDGRDGTSEIYYRKSSDNGMTWAPETRLTNDPATQHMPSVAASGSFVNVAWHDQRNGLDRIFCKGSTDTGDTWGEDIPVTQEKDYCYNPNLAFSDSVLHLVYQEFNVFSDIYYNSSIDGGKTWSNSMLLNDVSYSSQFPHIVVSGPALHVIWYDYRDFNYEIYYKHNPTGGMIGVEEQPVNSCAIIYPNPAGRQLTVGRLDNWTVGQSKFSGQQSAVRLSIIDLFGREVKEYEEISSVPYQIDISDLPDGLYILRITDESGNESAVKFIKRGIGYL